MIPNTTLELRDLRLVRAISSAGGVTAAARLLSISQSAVSHQLRNLEERLDLEVFERDGRGRRITEAGRRLLSLSYEVLEPVASLEADLRERGQERVVDLRIATQCFTAYHWLPQALERFAELHPSVRLKIVAEATGSPRAALRAGDLDLALAVGTTRDPRLCQRMLFSDELVLALPPGHRLAGKNRVSPEELVDEHLFLYELTAEVSEKMRQQLFPRGGGFRRVTRVALTEAIVELVKAGLGVSILAGWTIEAHVKKGDLATARLGRGGLERKWVAAYPRDTKLAAPIRSLISILKEMRGPEAQAAP